MSYVTQATAIAKARARRQQQAGVVMKPGEDWFNGVLWASWAATAAPEWLMALRGEAEELVPIVRLPGTAPEDGPAEAVRRDIALAAEAEP